MFLQALFYFFVLFFLTYYGTLVNRRYGKMEDWKNVILFLLSPAYLLPALISYVFFTVTRNAKVIEPNVIKEYKRWGKEHWYEAEIELHPYWGKKPDPSVLLVPIVNIYCLIGGIWDFWRCKRITNIYLELHSSI